MIFKTSLFLATISTANARMRGQVAADEKIDARQLMGGMGSGRGMGGMNVNTVPLTSVRSIEGTENALAGVEAGMTQQAVLKMQESITRSWA